MPRGRLRVMLGAAPGVGKSFAMLEEGIRLSAAGRDVVVAFAEAHGRAATEALAGRLPAIPRRRVRHEGIFLDEMDLEAVIERRPDVALVDDLAHTNAPGSTHEKRWQDVETMLDAGIDVISTVNIQHIESLNDFVHRTTGIQQHETIPDAVLRRADQLELVDLAPDALRERLRDGMIYPASRVDATLSNYFRLGNLTALREAALLWLADEVDSDLKKYRAEKGIEATWNARERVVVALSGGQEGQTLIRRADRIATRSAGGELFAVHVTPSGRLTESDPQNIAAQRALVEKLGGSYYEVIGEQIPRALVDFAKSVDATQLVIGVSRRGPLARLLTGQGTAATVIREAGDIDVHIVSHAQAGSRRLPTLGGALSPRRRMLGFAIAAAGLPLLTWGLGTFRNAESITSEVLVFQLLVVIVALVGGIWPALAAAISSWLLLNYFFIDPLYTLTIKDPLHLLALVIFGVVAVLVSVVADHAARRSRTAARAAAEAATLGTIASSVLGGEDALAALVRRLRESFGMAGVVLRLRGKDLYTATDGSMLDERDIETTFPIGDQATLYMRGRDLPATDRRILGAFLTQIESALQKRELASEAERMRPAADADRLRTALLAAVSHDLRRPLAAATAAVTALRSSEVRLSVEDEAELLAAAEESLDSLSSLVTKLLDASRLQAGVLGVSFDSVALDGVVGDALDELGLAPGDVQLDLDGSIPPVTADPVLLERTVVNLLTNALRFSPPGKPPLIAASRFRDRVQLRVIDAGPGIPANRIDDVFVAFQRLGDTDNTTGVGLGLSLAKGFVEAMGGALDVEETPGGGVTMVIELDAA